MSTIQYRPNKTPKLKPIQIKIIASMSVILNLLFFSFPVLAQHQWRLIGRSNEGNEFFIDRASIEHHRIDRYHFVTFLQYVSVERNDRILYSNIIVNCDASSYSILASRLYELRSNRLLESIEYGVEAEVKRLGRGSLLESSASFACQNRR